MAQYARKMTGTGDVALSENISLRVHSFRRGSVFPGGSLWLTDFDIARELHDSVGQQLTAVSLLLGRVARNQAGKNPSQTDEIHRIQEHLLNISREVQSLSRRAKCATVTARTFTRAVRDLLENVRRATGLHTIVMLSETSLPSDATAEHLYRIVQEAVHNVIRHAEASRLCVILKTEEQSICLVVRDDGKGMSVEARGEGGLGLGGMSARAEALGAQLEIRSLPGRGTAVRCVVPF
ncbi:MAG: hypothetical protein JW849_08600 [Phycisphaerae bacterium]|nr:hypothetical protein [Phycisphaerae bacterium]